ncbi:GDSL-type esterase/lipase family protein [Bacillus cereus group sp. MYBK87-1]|uniref:GDSL-type esterase/lipase family protein n=2 Tax=unclassified Bacillus cereus group TaxID=2750818 RepID=UPI003F7928CC
MHQAMLPNDPHMYNHFASQIALMPQLKIPRVENILKRINYVNSVDPKKIFVMMGINDLQGNKNPIQIKQNYKEVITELRNKNPNAQIYIQSIFHVNKDKYPLYFGKDAKQLNMEIDNLNKDIEDLSSKINNVYWINNTDIFGVSNQLPSKYTIDGLHLNKKGYELWIKNLNIYISLMSIITI